MAGIYIHIPFCKQACHYCDFHFSTSLKYKDELLSAICKEISLQKNYFVDEPVETISFGGGTPSLLSNLEINRIIDSIGDNFTISKASEITLEANPDDLNLSKVSELKQTPVNRLSIGIQSFFDEDLIWMNRAHRAAEGEDAVKRAQDAGFENITTDLIFGYSLLTPNKWEYNIEKLLSLDVPHLSAYAMTVEPDTALAYFISKKKSPPLDEHQSAEQFTLLSDTLQKVGYEHYEISNYAKPGKYSRHNTNYWRGVSYLGIGPSAHSYNGETRQWNIANNAKYIESLNRNVLPDQKEVLSQTEKLNEYIMTSLRTMWGLDLSKLEKIAQGASEPLLLSAQSHLRQQWLQQKENKLLLTPAGKLYADTIAAALFF